MRKILIRTAICLWPLLTQSFDASAMKGARIPANAPTDAVRTARRLAAEGKVEDATRVLNESMASETDKAKLAARHFARGLILFDAGKIPEAEADLEKAVQSGMVTEDYVHFYLGLIRLRTDRPALARAAFEKALSGKAPIETQLEARYHIADAYLSEKNWKAAALVLEPLKRKWRGNVLYPTVMFNLLRAQLHAGRRAEACKAARELYAKFPSHPSIHEWSADLAKNKVDDVQLPCVASDKDLRMRIRRLQWSGEPDRALAEIKKLAGRPLANSDASDDTEDDAKDGAGDAGYSIDSLLANHYINEGQVDEAMKLLLKHYDTQKKRPGYLLLVAKAASRAGDFQASVGAFQRAYEMAPRSKNSANTLFQAAFTSYQMQDYDGATKRFEKLVKAFPNSRLTRDSQWVLAWMRYLRSDYSGAYESLKKLSTAPKARLRRGRHAIATDSVSVDRVKYWSAMCLLRMGKSDEAMPLFQALVRDPAIGYYAIASYYRLLALPGAKLPPGIEARLGLKKSEASGVAANAPGEEEAIAAAAREAAQSEAEYAAAAANGTVSEEADAGGDEDDASVAAAGESGVEATADADLANATFSDVILSRRFERARELSNLGLEEAARRELIDVERRARSGSERIALMDEYQQVRNFYRSSYLGDVAFGARRMQTGLRGEGRPFWVYAYPRAYEHTVVESSKSASVPEEFIWGIMRAESHFRQDAQSAVGALGLMQLMPFTGRQVAQLLEWKGFETPSLLVPENNIKLGTRYLQRLLHKFSGSIPLAAASYNAGPHRVHVWVRNFGSLDMDEFIEHIPFVETRNYVKKVVRNYQIYSLLYGGGGRSAEWLARPVGVVVEEKIPTREIW